MPRKKAYNLNRIKHRSLRQRGRRALDLEKRLAKITKTQTKIAVEAVGDRILINEDSRTSPPRPGTSRALERSLLAREVGFWQLALRKTTDVNDIVVRVGDLDISASAQVEKADRVDFAKSWERQEVQKSILKS